MTDQSLITRLRDAEGADRGLDREIICAIRADLSIDPMSGTIVDDDGNFIEIYDEPKPLTASLDMAMALIEKALPGWLIAVHEWEHQGERFWWTELYPDIDAKTMMEHAAREKHKRAAISALIALLQAQGAQE